MVQVGGWGPLGFDALTTIYPISLFGQENVDEEFRVGLLNFTHFSGSLAAFELSVYTVCERPRRHRARGPMANCPVMISMRYLIAVEPYGITPGRNEVPHRVTTVPVRRISQRAVIVTLREGKK